MSQLVDSLIGLDPSGDGVVLLCGATCALLAVLIAAGFAMIRPVERTRTSKSAPRATRSATHDVVELWRLHRAVRSESSPVGASRDQERRTGSPV